MSRPPSVQEGPRNGDETSTLAETADGGHQPRQQKLRLKIPHKKSSDTSVHNHTRGEDGEKTNHAVNIDKGREAERYHLPKLPSSLQWIPTNWTWSKIKIAIRCAIATWVALVLFVIPKVETTMGQASFLILVASFFSPPSDPFVAVCEREFFILLYVSLAWAWVSLGMKFADLARSNRNSAPSLHAVFSGQYIEASPTVILAVFMFLGSAFFLYLKVRLGPGPFLFASIFACICIDISLTTGVLFPYPYYQIGQVIFIPLAIHSAIAILASITIFPSTVSAQFTTRCQGVITPLITSLKLHRDILKTPTDDPEFSYTDIKTAINQSEGALGPLAASARLIKSDIIWCRFAPTDFSQIHNLVRRLALRANGMTSYFTLIDPTRERFPVTPAPSKPGTPIMTPRPSRPPSPDHETEGERTNTPSQVSTPITNTIGRISTPITRRRQHVHTVEPRSHSRSHSHSRFNFAKHTHTKSHSQHHQLHTSLLHFALSRASKSEFPVGVFESQRYLDFEASHFSDTDASRHVACATALLSMSCDELLGTCGAGLQGIQDWLIHVRDDRFNFWKGRERENRIKERIRRYEDLRDEVTMVRERFRNDKRLLVLAPYRPAFDPKHTPLASEVDLPPHRHLFHCYVYQYHLMEFSKRLLDILSEILRLENERKRIRLWTPAIGFRKLFSWSVWQASENMEHDDEENPEIIPGMEPAWVDDLGLPQKRDPDALPPRNMFESIMNVIHQIATSFGGGNVLFALKAALLSLILCIPTFLSSSASFAYQNKFVWAIIMGQLTIARFRGDTTFGLVARILSTFLGGVVGMVMWYISSGSGRGNPFGLAAVCGVCFPLFFYARLYWPGPPMTSLIFFVTSALVYGYSYQNHIVVTASSPGVGFDVAWRRFVLVTIGVIGAFIFSFLPPSTTIRRYQRTSLSTTSAELGAVYCSIVSYANSTRSEDTQEIVQSLIAIRSKLKRSIMLRANVIYEFSLRGRWPAERYHNILEIQLQISNGLSHLTSVVEHLDPVWSQAFLRRTRFLDSDFQGDVLAVISMVSTSLRTGTPLPQITPCPLVDRFMAHHHGLNVIQQESDEDYGLPRTMTMHTLEDEQYSMFCVGVSTAFGIITRLDRLMVAVKELVGEQYHIHGVGLRHIPRHGIELGSRTNSYRDV